MSNKPDYTIGAIDNDRDVKQSRIGAAWVKDNGQITIRFDPFVTLQGGPHLILTMFPQESDNPPPARTTSPRTARTRGRGRPGAGTSSVATDSKPDFDDEVPF